MTVSAVVVFLMAYPVESHERRRFFIELKWLYYLHTQGLFESDLFIYLVTELLTGGELFDRIVERGVCEPFVI